MGNFDSFHLAAKYAGPGPAEEYTKWPTLVDWSREPSHTTPSPPTPRPRRKMSAKRKQKLQHLFMELFGSDDYDWDKESSA